MNEPDTSQARIREAQVQEALDRARQAKAEADEAEQRKRKAEAEADAAEPKPASSAPDPTKDATDRKTIAEAERDEAVARAARITAFVPDLAKVSPSTLEVKSDGPAIGTAILTHTALRDAAEDVAQAVRTALFSDVLAARRPRTSRVLLTADPDLASSVAVHRSVVEGIVQLKAAAQRVAEAVLSRYPDLDATSAARLRQAAGLPAPRPRAGERFVGAAVGAAIAAVVPGVLSALAVQRTLRSTTVTLSDLAAAAAVAGELLRTNTADEQVKVVHESFRTLPSNGPFTVLSNLLTLRSAMTPVILELAERKRIADDTLGRAANEIPELVKATVKEPDKATGYQLRIDECRRIVETTTAEVVSLGQYLGSLQSAGGEIDAFATVVQADPSGGRSPLATAALLAGLGQHGTFGFDSVLLVSVSGAQTDQATAQRAIAGSGHYSVMAEAALTYMLLNPQTGNLSASGTQTSVVFAGGKIGTKLEVQEGVPSAGTGQPTGGDGDSWKASQLAADGLSPMLAVVRPKSVRANPPIPPAGG